MPVVLVVDGYNRNSCTTYRCRQSCAARTKLKKNARFGALRGGRQKLMKIDRRAFITEALRDMKIMATLMYGLPLNRESFLPVIQGRVGLEAPFDAATMEASFTLLLVNNMRATLQVVPKTQTHPFWG